MNITQEQALDLLKKWQVERRLIQGGIFQSDDGTTSGFFGRIERLDNHSLTIDARSLFPLGDRCGLQLPLEADYSYRRDQRLGEAYDSALFIVITPGWHIELFAIKVKSEISQT
jgi:hypothetical protein